MSVIKDLAKGIIRSGIITISNFSVNVITPLK